MFSDVVVLGLNGKAFQTEEFGKKKRWQIVKQNVILLHHWNNCRIWLHEYHKFDSVLEQKNSKLTMHRILLMTKS
jgi:hypothetical protein